MASIETRNAVDTKLSDQERQGEISRRKLEAMKPEQKKAVADTIKADSRWSIALETIGSTAGAFWDGWEKGVNGAVDGTAHLLKGTGKWIGETAAEAVVGKEGGLTEKLVKDTQWIRDGLDVTGEVLGTTAAKVFATGEGEEVWKNMKDYWGGKADQFSKMNGEERAKFFGEGAAFVATAAVAAKGLNTLGKTGVLSQEMNLGNSAVARGAGKVISEGGQIGMELATGSNQRKMKLGENPAFKKQRGAVDLFASTADAPKEGFKHIFERLSALKKSMGTSKETSNMIDKAIESARFENKTEALEQMVQIFNSKEQTKPLAEELKKALDIVKARKTVENAPVGVAKPEPVPQETIEIDESLKGRGHRGRIDKLTEIFAKGNPDKKAFSIAAKERLTEAERFLDNEVELKRLTTEQRQEKTQDFLNELATAAGSHSPQSPAPVFKNVTEAKEYLDSISH